LFATLRALRDLRGFWCPAQALPGRLLTEMGSRFIRIFMYKLWFFLALLCPILISGQVLRVDDGPIHEAFISKVQGSFVLEAINNAPPEPIIERTPSQIANDAVWIPGYWHWSQNRAFIWVTGIWRFPPAGRNWISGSWMQVDNGWVWLPGF